MILVFKTSINIRYNNHFEDETFFNLKKKKKYKLLFKNLKVRVILDATKVKILRFKMNGICNIVSQNKKAKKPRKVFTSGVTN